jgi:MtN3 and saliva related transmembrane protein
MDSIFGWLVTAGTFIYKLPQIYKLYKTKSSNDVSTSSLVIQTIGYVFYIIHGVIIEDNPTITMGGISLLQGTILVVLCCLYKTVEAGTTGTATEDIEMVVL